MDNAKDRIRESLKDELIKCLLQEREKSISYYDEDSVVIDKIIDLQKQLVNLDKPTDSYHCFYILFNTETKEWFKCRPYGVLYKKIPFPWKLYIFISNKYVVYMDRDMHHIFDKGKNINENKELIKSIIDTKIDVSNKFTGIIFTDNNQDTSWPSIRTVYRHDTSVLTSAMFTEQTNK